MKQFLCIGVVCILLLSLQANALDCSKFSACHECISSEECGWWAKTDSEDFKCVEGDNFTCIDCPQGQYQYFYDHCPIDLHQVVYHRRAVRKYDDVLISKETIDAIITDATWAPSAMDFEPWRWFVVGERAIINQISDYIKKARNITTPGDIVYYGAPVVVFLFTDNACPGFDDVDGGLALDTFLLSAYNRGLATCPIGFSRLGEPIIRDLLSVPSSFHFVIGITLGHALLEPTHDRKPPVITYV